jgi:hypothetical protein
MGVTYVCLAHVAIIPLVDMMVPLIPPFVAALVGCVVFLWITALSDPGASPDAAVFRSLTRGIAGQAFCCPRPRRLRLVSTRPTARSASTTG